MKTVRWSLLLLTIWILYIWAAQFTASWYNWVSPLAVGISIVVMAGVFAYVIYIVGLNDPSIDPHHKDFKL